MGLGFPNRVEDGTAAAFASHEDPSLEELRRHFAREMHDQVAQRLIALVLDVRALKLAQMGPGSPDLADELSRLEESARAVLRQVREMMVDLRDRGALRIHLPQALKDELIVPAGHDLALQVTSRWPKQMNGWAAFNLLRLIQQAVANAWRHGRATRVDVVLDVGATDEAVVVVLDDGVGIEDAPFGFGIEGMRERATILGGTFEALPRDSGGTRVEVRFPVDRLK